jgi:hypothetical protein
VFCPAEGRSVDPRYGAARLPVCATRGRFRPRRFATSTAQRFKLENRVVRVSITLAASYSAVRTDSSPVRVAVEDIERFEPRIRCRNGPCSRI